MPRRKLLCHRGYKIGASIPDSGYRILRVHVPHTRSRRFHTLLILCLWPFPARMAVEYFVLLTVAGTQPEDEGENYIVLFSWAVIS